MLYYYKINCKIINAYPSTLVKKKSKRTRPFLRISSKNKFFRTASLTQFRNCVFEHMFPDFGTDKKIFSIHKKKLISLVCLFVSIFP